VDTRQLRLLRDIRRLVELQDKMLGRGSRLLNRQAEMFRRPVGLPRPRKSPPEGEPDSLV